MPNFQSQRELPIMKWFKSETSKLGNVQIYKNHKYFLKWRSSTIQKHVFANKCSQKSKQTSKFNKKKWISLQYIRKPIWAVVNEIRSRDNTKTSNTSRSYNLKDNFMTWQCSRHYIYKMLSARNVNHHFLLIRTFMGLSYKRTTRNENKWNPKIRQIRTLENF